MKVYMPLKPIKYGFEAYILSGAKTAYVMSWRLREGGQKKKKNKKETILPVKDIIASLTQNYQNLGYIKSMDRYYTTLSVVKELTKNGFGCIGVIMDSRLLTNKKMKKLMNKLDLHDSKFYVCQDSLILACWKDSKIVKVISNFGNDNVCLISRNTKDGNDQHQKKIVSCPQVIQTYSQNARGVDLLDQMLSYYEIRHRSKKWYIRLVLHFLHVATHNSFILYTHSKAYSNKIHYIDFLKSLIRSLVSPLRIRLVLKFTPEKKKLVKLLNLHQMKMIVHLSLISNKFVSFVI